MPSSTFASAVFLDRDGTIMPDFHYLDNVEQVELFPEAGAALQLLTAAGFVLVLITNQSGVGRGYFPLQTVHAQHQRLQELLDPYQVRFADIQICPHAPEQVCTCRKPLPGMLQQSAQQLGIDLQCSYVIGDKTADVQAGHAAGCTSVQVRRKYDIDPDADYVAADLSDAATWICAR